MQTVVWTRTNLFKDNNNRLLQQLRLHEALRRLLRQRKLLQRLLRQRKLLQRLQLLAELLQHYNYSRLLQRYYNNGGSGDCDYPTGSTTAATTASATTTESTTASRQHLRRLQLGLRLLLRQHLQRLPGLQLLLQQHLYSDCWVSNGFCDSLKTATTEVAQRFLRRQEQQRLSQQPFQQLPPQQHLKALLLPRRFQQQA